MEVFRSGPAPSSPSPSGLLHLLTPFVTFRSGRAPPPLSSSSDLVSSPSSPNTSKPLNDSEAHSIQSISEANKQPLNLHILEQFVFTHPPPTTTFSHSATTTTTTPPLLVFPLPTPSRPPPPLALDSDQKSLFKLLPPSPPPPQPPPPTLPPPPKEHPQPSLGSVTTVAGPFLIKPMVKIHLIRN
ncbi:hypothetical protein QVD17_06573 [Tagetes erecta]|uniref:Uncharacterized protein n=1 Tax=Tagetes erecta TaxID=13708 RepID=A0AAD8LLY7_TARER|nr:hypothetical protein QVD17_06573 [Tagetes erecta]